MVSVSTGHEKMQIKRRKLMEVPGEEGSTVTSILSSSTSFRMSFPIRLNSIDLGALVTFPFLLAVFPAVMFLDSGEIAQGT